MHDHMFASLQSGAEILQSTSEKHYGPLENQLLNT